MPDARSPVVSWARSSIPHEFESTELTVEELKERIRQLEKSRSVSLDNQERTEDIATGDTISKGPILRGTPDQSRFFGMGHWLTIKKEVKISNSQKEPANQIVRWDSFVEGW